jgi:amino acid permease
MTIIGLNLIAYYFTSISSVISIIGATADIYLVFVMPIMLYLAHKPKRDWKRHLSVFIFIMSLLVGGTHLLSKLTITLVDIL